MKRATRCVLTRLVVVAENGLYVAGDARYAGHIYSAEICEIFYSKIKESPIDFAFFKEICHFKQARVLI